MPPAQVKVATLPRRRPRIKPPWPWCCGTEPSRQRPLWKGKLLRSLGNMTRFFFTALAPGLQTEMPKEENSDPFPLGVAISGGFAWAMLEDGWMDALPLLELGG